MLISEYYPDYFKADVELLTKHHISCLCNRIWNKIFKEYLNEELSNIKWFTICSFELNLIDQVLYTHFRSEHENWKNTMPGFITCRCTYMSNPIGIFQNALNNARNAKCQIGLKRSDIIDADKLFLNQLETFLKSNSFTTVTLNEIISAIKSDPDCNASHLSRILNRYGV